MHSKGQSLLLLYNIGPDWSTADINETLEAVAAMLSALESAGRKTEPVEVRGDLLEALRPFSPDDHLVFNWCEEVPGQAGSEPDVAAVLEAQGFGYTGARAWPLAAAQRKMLTKSLLQAHGVPTPAGRLALQAEADGWSRFPAIVKVANWHCSESLDRTSVVDTPEELAARAVESQAVYGEPALVEEFLDGREFRACVIGDESPQVLPLVQMGYDALEDYHDRLCSYEAKFSPGTRPYEMIELLCPAEVEAETKAKIEQAAVGAFRALGCRDYARIDIRLNDGVAYVLDVNPNPDISIETSFYYAAEAAGHDYPALANTIVELAARRRAQPRPPLRFLKRLTRTR